MKVFFTASLHASIDVSVYQKIVSVIEKMGHTVKADHIIGTASEKLETLSLRERTDYHRKMSKAISSCDVMVCEVSFPSTITVGHEVTLALDKGMPVVALHQPGKEPGVLQGLHSDRFMLLEYIPSEVSEVLEYSLEDVAEKIDIRYNFFISPKMVRFLDYIAKETKTPRAVFLRQLIEKDMKVNEFEE